VTNILPSWAVEDKKGGSNPPFLSFQLGGSEIGTWIRASQRGAAQNAEARSQESLCSRHGRV
jgi:hypothetical protein